jgi:hypothetical protein
VIAGTGVVVPVAAPLFAQTRESLSLLIAPVEIVISVGVLIL